MGGWGARFTEGVYTKQRILCPYVNYRRDVHTCSIIIFKFKFLLSQFTIITVLISHFFSILTCAYVMLLLSPFLYSKQPCMTAVLHNTYTPLWKRSPEVRWFTVVCMWTLPSQWPSGLGTLFCMAYCYGRKTDEDEEEKAYSGRRKRQLVDRGVGRRMSGLKHWGGNFLLPGQI